MEDLLKSGVSWGRVSGVMKLSCFALALASVLLASCGGGNMGLTEIKLSPVQPDAVLIAPPQAQPVVQFSLDAVYSDGRLQTVTTGITWSSSNPEIATIASNGAATPKQVGDTTIEAIYSGQKVMTILSVMQP